MPEKTSMSAVEHFFDMHDLWTKSHAGHALLSAAILDQELRTAILKKMRPGLSNKKQERIFEGFGPLSEFAAKIELAYALDQIDDDIYGKLRIIKEIRDKFAHLPKECTFFSGEIRAIIQKFHFTGKASYPKIFDQIVEACFNHLAERAAKEGA
jgi:DNA-binding MltR family transcriptional regulator